ncbi:MAG TPA: DoxX family protein [Cyclobacteriaceae bacterium]|jgi:putative oxidoreductase
MNPVPDKHSLAMLFIRIPVGFHLIYGVVDNVVSWERMLEFRDFLDGHHFPLPLFCAVVSVYAQLLCGMMYILGVWIRVAAAIMIFNFAVALIGVHIGDAYPPAFPAIIILCNSVVLLLLGSGRLSLRPTRH